MSKASKSSIPLFCSICPKGPRFSDTSHLLTHISSKSHLSHRFQLQIRAQTELAANDQLDTFDEWYESHGLGQMLAERLAVKEKDRKGSRRSKSSASTMIKTEMKADEEQTSSVPPPPASTPVPLFRAPMPVMHTWERDDVPRYATPTMGRNIPNFSHHQTPDNSTRKSLGSDEAEEYDVDDAYNGCKPKGVLWPGMGLFDAATSEMKRRRNQKKDASVLVGMKRSSRDTQQYEYEYEQDGQTWELKRVRDIFGPLSVENTPVKNPSKKYNTRQKQGPLSTMSSNITRPKQPASTINFETPKSRSKPTHTRVLRSATKPESPYSEYFNRPFEPSADEDHEFQRAIEELTAKEKKAGIKRLALFSSPSDNFASPSRIESPLEDHRFDFPQGFSLRSSVNVPEQITPTRIFKPIPTRSYEKENIEDLPDVKQHIPADFYQMPYYQQVPYNPLFSQSGFSGNSYLSEPAPGDWKPVMDHEYSGSGNPQHMAPQNITNANDSTHAFHTRF